MKLLIGFVLCLATLTIFSCRPKLSENFHMQKMYWDKSDYDEAIRQIMYETPDEEGHPRLSDPITAGVFNKLVDLKNVSVILEDEQLGLKYRRDVGKEFFQIGKQLMDIYEELDVQDKYVYPLEFVRIIEFNLNTQLLYFKTGNDAIIKDAIEPDANDIKRLILLNEQTLVDNFTNYIELLSNENAYTPEALSSYARIIDIYFGRLLKEFPTANFAGMKKTAQAILNKSISPQIKRSLNQLIENINKLDQNTIKPE